MGCMIDFQVAELLKQLLKWVDIKASQETISILI